MYFGVCGPLTAALSLRIHFTMSWFMIVTFVLHDPIPDHSLGHPTWANQVVFPGHWDLDSRGSQESGVSELRDWQMLGWLGTPSLWMKQREKQSTDREE